MKSNIIAAAILGVCLIVAAALFGGRYSFQRVGNDRMVRLDRWTGSTKIICLSEWDWSPVCVTLSGRSASTNVMNNVMNVDENLTTVDVGKNSN